MTTHVTTHSPARSDVAAVPTPDHGHSRGVSRGWAVAGIGAAVSAILGTAASFSLGAVYDPDLAGDAEGIVAALSEKTAAMVGFHVFESIAALLMIVFAVGLFRRLRSALPAESLLPALATAGLLGTSVVLVLATGLDTEFVFATLDTDLVVPEALVFYNHWVGTIPGCWILVGLTGIALFAAARQGGVPRWMGRTGLVLGGLTLLVAVAPMQYMAGMTGTLMLLALAVGFTVGDKEHRGA